MKTIVKIVVKTVRNVRVSTLVVCVVCFWAFLFFSGKPETNFVVAQENHVVAKVQDEQEETLPAVTPLMPPRPVTLDQELPKPLTQEQLEAIAIQPATKYEETGSRVVPAMLPLFKEESITYTGKEKYKDTVLKYRLHVPENLEQGKKYPLILWLHGAGEVGEDNKLQLVHLHHIITYLTGEKKRDFFLLVPQAPAQHGSWAAHFYTRNLPENLAKLLNDPQKRENILKEYESTFGYETKATISITEIDGKALLNTSEPLEDSPLGFSFAMLDQVIENYPVDTDRITVSGLSTGGDGTWRALEYRPELFAAAVPLVSWRALTDIELQKSPVLKKIPIWAIYSSDDSGIDQARSDFERVEKAGCNVKKSEFGICGHNAWTPAMLQADIFSWLLSRAKKDGEYIAVVDANVNPDDLKGIVEVATRDPGKPKLAPAPPRAVQQTVKETEKNEWKPAATFSVPQSQPQLQNVVVPQQHKHIITRQYRNSAGNIVSETETREAAPPNAKALTRLHALISTAPPTPPPTAPPNAKDELYVELATQYFNLGNLEDFSRNFVKISSPMVQKFFAEKLLKRRGLNHEQLRVLEKMIDQIPQEVPISQDALQQLRQVPALRSQAVSSVPSLLSSDPLPSQKSVPAELPSVLNDRIKSIPNPKPAEPPKFTAQRGNDEEVAVTGKVIEDCDRPWAMTSDSLYGMFPADWN
ncbi:MAG: hypothetical protein LBF88_08605, partial [Planctomycetaceae bacterium]|nr:hypothetical protein [Planctomycetaceae bacterium]